MGAESLDQAADPKWRPPQWLIPRISKFNVWIYERSNGKYGADGGGMSQLLLSVVGRKSGNPQTVALPFWVDADGSMIIVASFGGAEKHPAWFHNVRDLAANPTVTIRLRDTVYQTSATVLSAAERDRVWPLLTSDRPNFARYQARTERVIPLVRIPPPDHLPPKDQS